MTNQPTFPMTCGTDGWRGVIARECTFETIGALAEATALYTLSPPHPAGVSPNRIVIGWDRRFLSKELAGEAAVRLCEAGLHVLLSDRAVPTPAVSLAVRSMRLKGGIIITASHNPAAYNGFKYKGHYGGSATPEIYGAIEALVGQRAPEADGGTIELVDLETPYRQAIAGQVDVDAIRDAAIRVLVDPLHGAGGTTIAAIAGRGRTTVETMRAEENPGFGGVNPEPIPENLAATARRVVEGNFDLAVATDGDGDRLGALDPAGRFVSPHQVLSLFALHLIRDRGETGGIGKTFSTTLRLDRIARSTGVPLFETRIGFKYLAPLLEDGRAMLAGEESGGIGFGSFLPDRDGSLSALVLLDLMASRGKKLPELLDELDREFGPLAYGRRDVHLPLDRGRLFLGRLASAPPREVAGVPVSEVRDLDGIKLIFGDPASPEGWLLHRLSGTEPMVRLYCEHPDPSKVEAILEDASTRLESC
jgi:phosphomannomutase